jgi:hypothetical protein
MSRLNLLLLSMFGLIVGVHPMLAATFAVGTCKPNSFTTISAAVSTVPAGSLVLVCPGTYKEQVRITKPLTLEGIASGNSDQAVIAPPAGGLATNATNDNGQTLAVQLWVDNAPGGPVNITNITVDGTGNGVTGCPGSPNFVVGIFYQNSAGTANRVAIRNQKGQGCGVGIWAEGGSALPTVTIENSSVHDVDFIGIHTETNASTSELTATIKANDVNVGAASIGIFLKQGSNTTVSANVVIASQDGIEALGGAAGSVSGNTVLNAQIGILTESDGVSVTSNRVFNSPSIGIVITTAVAAIQSNSITNSNVGIEFSCSANPNVIHNTIEEAQTGINHVPLALAAPNTYFDVATIRTGGC